MDDPGIILRRGCSKFDKDEGAGIRNGDVATGERFGQAARGSKSQ